MVLVMPPKGQTFLWEAWESQKFWWKRSWNLMPSHLIKAMLLLAVLEISHDFG